MKKKRPSFRKSKSLLPYTCPEELFAKLPNRASSHGYLRGPQTDVLREYADNVDANNIALELPTGTGKTTVGLLIAEWRRRKSNQRVTYLALTNQLAKQILKEAANLGIDCADLTGTKATRDPGEVGRYKLGRAVGVTTYSNLFNVNPVIKESDVLILDDAHGGEHYASDMWTVRINKNKHSKYYAEMLTAISPALTGSQYRVITDEMTYASIKLIDVHSHPDVSLNVTSLLDPIRDKNIRFPWNLIRNNLSACLFFASAQEITIRPIVPPTHTHEPFIEANQRIFMSATLGGGGDLQRGYGITDIKSIRAKHPQWGKRYIFIPGLYLDEEVCFQLVTEIWSKMETHRALILTPSFLIGDKIFSSISPGMEPMPVKLGADEIEDSLEPFTLSDGSILCLARYDGLDLPGDDCRLLIMAESPAAVSALERHLREHWKLGPVFMRRERTRLIQGMGRCTRDATDYAVIILLKQSLIDSVTKPILAQTLPGEIQKELNWGKEQVEVAREDPDAFKDMILGLLSDSEYRKEANENIEEMDIPEGKDSSADYDESGKQEVKYAKALWDGDFSAAYKFARDAADEINEPTLLGYRAWWFYLATFAAHHLNNTHDMIDSLKRARATGINVGFLDQLLRNRNMTEAIKMPANVADIHAENIWQRLEKWGWQGPNFRKKLDEMIAGISTPSDHIRFHIGLERLGQCLGAEALRPTEQATPDVVWIFHDRCYTFEAKSEKDLKGRLFKKNLQQAKGHPEWVRAQRPELKDIPMQPLVVSPGNEVDTVAKPFIKGLNYLSTDDIAQFAEAVASELQGIRTQFTGKEYGAVRDELKAKIIQANMSRDVVEKKLSNKLT